MGRARRRQRRHVRQLLRLRRDRAGRRFAPTPARLHRHSDRDAECDLQLAERHPGAHRRRHRRPFRHEVVDAAVRGDLHARCGPHRRLAAVPGHGRRTPAVRSRRRIDDCRDHRRHRPMVRRSPARVCVRRQSQHRPRRLVQRRHVDVLVQTALRHGMAAAALARGRLLVDCCGRVRRVLLARTSRQPPLSTGPAGSLGPNRLERSLALRSLLLVHRRPLRHLLFSHLPVSQHIRDQVPSSTPTVCRCRRPAR